jgi:hypothetical protein
MKVLVGVLAVVLVGPPAPARDKAQTVTDVRQLHHGHPWKWALVGAAVATGTVLAYEATKSPVRDVRTGRCSVDCVPPGGY